MSYEKTLFILAVNPEPHLFFIWHDIPLHMHTTQIKQYNNTKQIKTATEALVLQRAKPFTTCIVIYPSLEILINHNLLNCHFLTVLNLSSAGNEFIYLLQTM